jgi:hypothetical protein
MRISMQQIYGARFLLRNNKVAHLLVQVTMAQGSRTTNIKNVRVVGMLSKYCSESFGPTTKCLWCGGDVVHPAGRNAASRWWARTDALRFRV